MSLHAAGEDIRCAEAESKSRQRLSSLTCNASGGGGSPRLRGETEGVPRSRTVGNRKIFPHTLKALTSRFVGKRKNLHAAFSPGPSTRRILSDMTLARPPAHGLASPSLSQLSLTALLCVIAELVRSVAVMLGMRNRRQVRVCDTIQMPEALPQATHDTHQEANSTHGVILGLVPRISVGPTQGLANTPREAINQDARHKAEHDTVDVAQAADAGPPGSRPARAATQRPLCAPHAPPAHLPGRSPAVPHPGTTPA